jgi:hypothetical protein
MEELVQQLTESDELDS